MLLFIQHEKNGDRKSAKSELGKARQTIKSIQLNLESLENIKTQVKSEDQEICGKKLASVHNSVKEQIEEFQCIDADLMHYLDSDLAALLSSGLYLFMVTHYFAYDSLNLQLLCITVTEKEDSNLDPEAEQLQQHIDPQHEELSAQLTVTKQDEERIERIAQDVNDVKELMTELNTLVTVSIYAASLHLSMCLQKITLLNLQDVSLICTATFKNLKLIFLF